MPSPTHRHGRDLRKAIADCEGMLAQAREIERTGINPLTGDAVPSDQMAFLPAFKANLERDLADYWNAMFGPKPTARPLVPSRAGATREGSP